MELSDEARKYAEAAIRQTIDFDYENADIEAEEYERYEREANEALAYLGCEPIDHSWRVHIWRPEPTPSEALVNAIEEDDKQRREAKGAGNEPDQD
jgi:hypothetical protein